MIDFPQRFQKFFFFFAGFDNFRDPAVADHDSPVGHQREKRIMGRHQDDFILRDEEFERFSPVNPGVFNFINQDNRR